MKISLILPVYNVEQYLSRCIDSCLDQNLSQDEYEIIIVNDGSLDCSIDIANDYAKKNKCIKIITQANMGLSAARNTGLNNAKGEYVWFIDSDDYIEKDCLSGIYNEIRSLSLDILWIKWCNKNEENKIIPLYDSTFTYVDYKIYTGLDFMENIMGIYYFAWSFIFSRDFLIKHKMLFQKGLYYEDSEFAYRTLPLASKIKLYNKICYTYNIRQGSIAQTFSEKKIEDLLYIADKAIAKYKEHNNKRCFIKSATNLIITALLQAIAINYLHGIKKIKPILKHNNIRLIKCGSKVTRIIACIYNIFGFHAMVMTAKTLNGIKHIKKLIS